MKISDLKKLFAGVIDVFSFKRLINNEVVLYERLHSKKGSSIPIELIEDEKLFFGKNELLFLCNSYIEGNLSKYEISYLSEAVLLSTCAEFENDLIEECLDLFGNIEDGESLSKEEIIIIIDRITKS